MIIKNNPDPASSKRGGGHKKASSIKNSKLQKMAMPWQLLFPSFATRKPTSSSILSVNRRKGAHRRRDGLHGLYEDGPRHKCRSGSVVVVVVVVDGNENVCKRQEGMALSQ
jgi:hypothetical protein